MVSNDRENPSSSRDVLRTEHRMRRPAARHLVFEVYESVTEEHLFGR